MNSERRRGMIIERVVRDGYASVLELAEELEVSPVTVHRDLEALAKDRVLKRVRGGARSFRAQPHEIRTEYALREAQNRDLKWEIANFAIETISERSVIFLDGSTTCASVFAALNQRPLRQLTIVTNSLAIAMAPHNSETRILLTPGDVDQSLRATVGSWAVDFLDEINIDLAFISGAAISSIGGLMTTQKSIADMSRALISKADRTVALVDSTKFGTQALISCAEAAEVHLLLSDSYLSDHHYDEYQKRGWKIRLAPRLEDSVVA